jgi:carbon storage regulator
MLVVTRKAGEAIQIGDDIWIHIVRCTGGQVKIGIDAPPDVLILRDELIGVYKERNHE